MKKIVRIITVPISFNLLKGQLHFMAQFYEVIGVSSPGKMLETVETEEKIRVQAIEMTRKITPFKDLKSLCQLYCFFRKEKPFIVHSHTPKAGIAGMMAAWLAGVPNRLHTVAGLPLMETNGVKRKLLNTVEKLTYTFATKIYPNSYGLKDFIINNKLCKPDKLEVIAQGSSNGINTAFFDPALYSAEDKRLLRKDLNIGERDFVFIYVGRLVKDKGINELVAAFGRLKSESNRFLNNDDSTFTSSSPIPKLLLVGTLEQELDPLFPETLEKIQSDHDIIYVGYQDDVRPYFAISDVLAFPSYREGFPNVVMQAGAMGLPSIVTNINGCNEIILEGKNGMIIPPKNEEALFEAMKYIMKHSTERQKMRKAARPLITSRYEQQLVWEALLEEYRSLETAFEKKNRQKNKRRTRNK